MWEVGVAAVVVVADNTDAGKQPEVAQDIRIHRKESDHTYSEDKQTWILCLS
jgi:hypothetical protein